MEGINGSQAPFSVISSKVRGPEKVKPTRPRPSFELTLELNVHEMTMKDVEKTLIIETYKVLGSAQGTADALGISLRKIHYRLKAYRNEGLLPQRTS